MGEKDVERKPPFRDTPEADAQGMNRMERCTNYFRQCKAKAEELRVQLTASSSQLTLSDFHLPMISQKYMPLRLPPFLPPDEPRLLRFPVSSGKEPAAPPLFLGGKKNVDVIAVANSGWFTMPDRDIDYPYGISVSMMPPS